MQQNYVNPLEPLQTNIQYPYGLRVPSVGQYISPTGYAPMVGGVPQAVGQGLGQQIGQSTLQAYANNQNRQPSIADQAKYNINQMSLGEKANAILGTVGTLMNAYNAYNANKLAHQQFNRHIYESDRNYENQMKLTNSRLSDRQRRRVIEQGANTANVPSVAQYMNQYGIK